jgi:hypothetical protein
MRRPPLQVRSSLFLPFLLTPRAHSHVSHSIFISLASRLQRRVILFSTATSRAAMWVSWTRWMSLNMRCPFDQVHNTRSSHLRKKLLMVPPPPPLHYDPSTLHPFNYPHPSPDTNNPKYRVWFYFRVSNVKKGQRIVLHFKVRQNQILAHTAVTVILL